MSSTVLSCAESSDSFSSPLPASEPVRILLLGATGSIGRQTLDVIAQHPDRFVLCGISAGHDLEGLQSILESFPSVGWAGLSSLSKEQARELEVQWAARGRSVHWSGGRDQMCDLVREAGYDLLVNAVVGFRGLKPTLEAIQRGKDLALANKESLVCGGELVQKALKTSPTRLTPIDSEHSAIFQCLQGNRKEEVARLIITASGGSLRDLSREGLQSITPAQALRHPSWKMGARITIDSATMVNKGFEVIEAHYLFDLPYEQIETVLHPQSIVHSMVEYQDHACIAQLGSADMRLPIQYALSAPERWPLQEEHPLDLTKACTLEFREMDPQRYPMLPLAIAAGKRKGNAGCIFNAADEQAVELFLQEKISFLQIEDAIRQALDTIEWIEDPSYEDLEETDRKTREFVRKLYS